VDEGTPQGSPLSPLLSNLVLDDLDKELARRGHRFCRYADDCNIYVRSRRAGERVMASMSRFLTQKLRLKASSTDPVARPLYIRLDAVPPFVRRRRSSSYVRTT
jgi:RNA-directed DNA polymerase